MTSYESELKRLWKEKRRAQGKNNLKELAEIYNATGEILSRQGKFEEALEEHTYELNLCEALQDKIGIAIACRKIGECYSELGDFKKALKYQHKHLDLAQETNSADEEQRAWATIGRTYLYKAESLFSEQNKYDETLQKAESAFFKSLETCQRLKGVISEKNYMEMKGRLLLNLGLVSDYKGKLEECVDLINKAIDINRKYDIYGDLHRCQHSLALTYRRHGKLTDSLKLLDDSLATAQRLKEKSLECESLLSRAQTLLLLSDFDGAKRSLKIAYRMKTPVDQDKQEIKKLLKKALLLCKTEDILITLSDYDYTKKLPLYEKMGDTSASIGNFKQALEYYHKMLDCAEKLEKSETDKIPIYTSLAQTYADDKQYYKATEFYQKELQCRKGNSKEESKTLLNIAECECEDGFPYERIFKYYQKAIQLSNENPRLKLNCLKALSWAQKKFNKEEELKITLRQLEELKINHGLSSDDEALDSEEITASQENASESDISELSDSEAENEEYDRPRPRRARRNFVAKKNEKGETPLHRACIAGNLKQVEKLVEEGHPVNVRDHSGWLPLHEAANHDFYDIVAYLLDHGACVNDRGGAFCDGISPLHDAASCGNIEIMKLLIERGASVVAKTNSGETPLDCLIKWRFRVASELSDSVMSECNSMENNLRKMMEKVGHSVPEILPQIISTSTNSTSNEKRLSCRSPENLYESESSDEEPFPYSRHKVIEKLPIRNAINDSEDMFCCSSSSSKAILIASDSGKDDQSTAEIDDFSSESEEGHQKLLGKNVDPHNPETAKEEYKNAMKGIKNALAHRLITDSPELSHLSNQPRAALIDEADVVVDDWLIDDVGNANRHGKRKCLDIDGKLFSSSSKRINCNSNEFKNSFKNLAANNNKKSKSLKQMKLYSKPTGNLNSREARNEDLLVETFSSIPKNSSPTHINECVTDDVTSKNFSSSEPAFSGILRVKVRIKDKLLLVPIANSDLDKTIGWLSQEVSKRYFSLSGIRPILSLSTKEGAVMSADDQITYVINSNEEIQANVDSWDLPSLQERYKSASLLINSEPNITITKIFETAELTGFANLKDIEIIQLGLKPIFQALKYQNTLKILSLGGCCLGDNGIQELVGVLITLPHLSSLDLSCNHITASGLQKLSESTSVSLQQEGSLNIKKPFEFLSELDLSFNPLGNNSTLHMATLIKNIPSLKKLNIESCLFTLQFFEHHRSDIVHAFQDSTKLQAVKFSYNQLGPTGVELLLKCLPYEHLISLDLTSTRSGKIQTNMSTNCICHHLVTYASQGLCKLEELIISDCNLVDACVKELARFFNCFPLLRNLILSNNPKLTAAAPLAIIKALKLNPHMHLNCIDCSGCSLITSQFANFTPSEMELFRSDDQNLSLKQLLISFSQCTLHNPEEWKIWSSYSTIKITANKQMAIDFQTV